MSMKSSTFNSDSFSRLTLLTAAILALVLVVLTAVNLAVRVPNEAETDDLEDALDGLWPNGKENLDGDGQPQWDGVTLEATDDAGIEYQDSLVFVGDALTAQLINKGVLTGGTNTPQVWRSESNSYIFNLNAEVTSTKIILPGSGEQMTVAQAAKEAKPSILIITLGADWGVSYLSEEEFKSCYDKLVKAVQKASPRTDVVLQSIFPVTAGCTSLDNSKIDTANQWVKEVAAANECYYLDTQSVLKDENNCLRADFCDSSNGMSLNQTAYATILAYIRTHAVPD